MNLSGPTDNGATLCFISVLYLKCRIKNKSEKCLMDGFKDWLGKINNFTVYHLFIELADIWISSLDIF